MIESYEKIRPGERVISCMADIQTEAMMIPKMNLDDITCQTAVVIVMNELYKIGGILVKF